MHQVNFTVWCIVVYSNIVHGNKYANSGAQKSGQDATDLSNHASTLTGFKITNFALAN